MPKTGDLFKLVHWSSPPCVDWLLATEAFMVGERAVHIILECFLVTLMHSGHMHISVYCAQVAWTCFDLILVKYVQEQTD